MVKKEVYARVRELVSIEEGSPLISGTAASLVDEAVCEHHAPQSALGYDAIKQVFVKENLMMFHLRDLVILYQPRPQGDTDDDLAAPEVLLSEMSGLLRRTE